MSQDHLKSPKYRQLLM